MTTAWIAVDWGTTNLRLWVMGDDGSVIKIIRSDRGMNKLSNDEFEPVLLELIEPYLNGANTMPILCCGMVGARQGWADAGYENTPCALPNCHNAVRVASNDPRISVRIIPGIKQNNPAGVMRGEETQIAGFLRQDPDFDGVVCLPGTHSKWTHISAKEVVSFQTFMTGELFDLLANQSVLRHSVSSDDFDRDSFGAAISDAMSKPEKIASSLFEIRAEDLVNNQSNAVARSRLSGLLIGAELAAARPYWLGRQVAIVGASDLADLYKLALSLQGISAQSHVASDMTVAGLTACYEELK